MYKYRFYWLNGMVEEAGAHTVSEAFTKLGYSAGALPALDYWVLVK